MTETATDRWWYLTRSCSRCTYWVNKGCCHLFARDERWNPDDTCQHQRRAERDDAPPPRLEARWPPRR